MSSISKRKTKQHSRSSSNPDSLGLAKAKKFLADFFVRKRNDNQVSEADKTLLTLSAKENNSNEAPEILLSSEEELSRRLSKSSLTDHSPTLKVVKFTSVSRDNSIKRDPSDLTDAYPTTSLVLSEEDLKSSMTITSRNSTQIQHRRNIYIENPKLIVTTKVSIRPMPIESATKEFFDWPHPLSPKSKRKHKHRFLKKKNSHDSLDPKNTDNDSERLPKTRSKSVDVLRQRRKQPEVKETSIIYKTVEGPQQIIYESGRVEYTRGKVNQYVIMNSIGSGAFGKVNLCKDENTGEFFACKVISKSRLKKKFRWSNSGPRGVPLDPSTHLSAIRREIDILKRMSHPHINPLIEYIDDPVEDNLYMSMCLHKTLVFELCEYGSIMKMKMHDKVHPYCEDLARKLFIDILLGLEYRMACFNFSVHYRGIIHRDIKPENLLLTANGIVQIADFGISLMVEDQTSEGDSVVNEKNASPLFSPPEACMCLSLLTT